MARSTGLASYQRSPAAVLNPADPAYLADELQRVEDAFVEVVLMTPQPATAAPRTLRDGMQRLARTPWRPIGGTVDRWVFWDAGASQWKPLNGT